MYQGNLPHPNSKMNNIRLSNQNGEYEKKHLLEDRSSWRPIESSWMARNTHNPIRSIVDGMKVEANPQKKLIPLSIGDPTTFGNLPLCDEIVDAVWQSLKSGIRNGYSPSDGYPDARQLVGEHHSTTNSCYNKEDVILTCGCSGALDLCIGVLASKGDNILTPRPGFSLYIVLSASLGIEYKEYDLIPDHDWEADLAQMESLIDHKTKAIVINNPSNPCGSVWTEEHISEILELAEKYRLPIIADEVYADFVFEGEQFTSFAHLSRNVPILTCGGLTKKYLVPGWRLGWILIHDPIDVFRKEIRNGLISLSQRILGPCSIVQGALGAIFQNTPASYFQKSLTLVKQNADYCYKVMQKVEGLKPIMPSGAMYMMIGLDMSCFPNFESDVDFTIALITQQSVFCLPASCFHYPNFFRVVLTLPNDTFSEACNRIADFCSDHYRSPIRKGPITSIASHQLQAPGKNVSNNEHRHANETNGLTVEGNCVNGKRPDKEDNAIVNDSVNGNHRVVTNGSVSVIENINGNHKAIYGNYVAIGDSEWKT